MANKPISMQRIKQIIRYHHEGMGVKRIVMMSRTSKNTVKQYLSKYKELGLSQAEIDAMDEYSLHRLFSAAPPKELVTKDPRYLRLEVLLPDIVKALRKRGMTIHKQWQLYAASEVDHYQRSQFGDYVRQYIGQSKSSMLIEHKAGDMLYLDYTGDKLHLIDKESGEVSDIEVFVGILPHSQLIYVRACHTQSTADFIECTRLCLEYIGGSPAAIVTDNLKASVIKSSKYEPRLNQAFESFGEHYSTAILPCRAYKPKDKALVEGAVNLVYQRIFTAIDEKEFSTLEDLNAAIALLLDELNLASFKGEESRRVRFEQDEKSLLKPLPAIAYELHQSRSATVMKNGHVNFSVDKHLYSVPYTYIGKKVRIVYTSSTISIYYDYKPIAQHSRDYRKLRYTTEKDHLASNHRFMSEWNPQFFIDKGKAIGEEVAIYLEKLMESKAHPEQGYKACLGVLNLAAKVGAERIKKACMRAHQYQNYTYWAIEDILTKNLDQIDPETETLTDKQQTPEHQNIRGNGYYN
ncbi:MAG TPA: IS21 family transposase [Bacteroidetes bacterium]|nr:IS21 family transposase [Bacteroidota bacterium]